MPYVYSTLSNDQVFTIWEKGGANVPRHVGDIKINGGANVINDRLWTPRGVATRVSAEDLSTLKAHPAFIDQVKGGYITVSDADADADDVAKDMTAKDRSAPLTPDSIKLAKGEKVKSASTESAPAKRGRGRPPKAEA